VIIDEDSHVVYGEFLSNSKWDVTINSDSYQATMAMYWALTSLSTTGFGDYYPVNNSERLVCALLLISGVSLFAYF